jgi:hypothetical protein
MFLLSPEADMRSGDLQAQFPWTNAFWFADREVRRRLTKGISGKQGRSVLRLQRTGGTRIVAESQGSGSFSLADSKPSLFLGPCRNWAANTCTYSTLNGVGKHRLEQKAI